MHPGRAAAFSVLVLLPSCGSSGPVAAVMPTPAVLDVFDQAVLDHSAGAAPTFSQVAQPRDESPRRFRAWLGWAPLACLGCDPDAGACPPCSGAYVCVRPSRVVPCHDDEIVSQSVMNDPDGPPHEGVYVFEGAWKARATGADAFEVTRVLSLADALPAQ